MRTRSPIASAWSQVRVLHVLPPPAFPRAEIDRTVLLVPMMWRSASRVRTAARTSASRRCALLALAVLAGCASDAALAPRPHAARVGASIVAENRATGDHGWYVPRAQRADRTELALWGSPYVLSSGDTMDLFVHSLHGSVRISVYRLGWYGGAGGRLVFDTTGVPADSQPACAASPGEALSCPWHRTTALPTSTRWLPGMYLLKATNGAGLSALYPFVLRSTAPAAILVVVPQFTWQAYNDFGGASLYTQDPTKPAGNFATAVSFERPYATNGGAAYVYSDGYSLELPAIRWLEREGYDVGYASDLDLATGAAVSAGAPRVLLFAGHDEYWTWGEFTLVESLRDARTHLVFLSGNDAFWNVRLGPGTSTGRPGQVVTCFKMTPDPFATSPTEVTTEFRLLPLNRPENALIGIMYLQGAGGPPRPLTISDSALGATGRAFLAGARLSDGDTISQLVRSEGDQLVNNGRTPRNLQVLARSPYALKTGRTAGAPQVYYTTFYQARSGAGVFAAGTNDFARGLDSLYHAPESARLQALLAGVLDWMLEH